MIKAVLFDMDGVLVDSEEFICQAGIEMFREKGLIVRKDDFKSFTGMGENRYLGGDWIVSDLSEAPEECLNW